MEEYIIKESLKYIQFLLIELREFSPFGMGINYNEKITLIGTNEDCSSAASLKMLLDKSEKDLLHNIFEIVCI